MSNSNEDGLCGIPSPFTTRDGLHLRCKFELGHGGDHDWKKYEGQFHLIVGMTRDEGFQRTYPLPEGCTCKPIRTTEGEIVDYVFSPDCKAHAKP